MPFIKPGLFCLLMFLIPLFSLAQEDSLPLWKLKYDTAQQVWSKDIARSITLLVEAEKIAFNDLGIYDENYLAILNDLGLALGEVKEYAKARSYLKQSIALQKELYADTDPHVLAAMCNLATIASKSGDIGCAKSIYNEVLRKSYAEKEDTEYFIASQSLMKIHEDLQQYDSALLIIDNELKMFYGNRKNLQEISLDKARVLRKDKRYSEASQLLNTIEGELDESIQNHTSLKYAIAVESALINIEQRQYIAAEKELLRLYRILKSNPNDEILLTEIIDGLGYVYERLNIYDKALAYYNESLARCVASHGFNSISSIIVQNNIAGVYLKQGAVKEAIREYEEFLVILKTMPGDNRMYFIAANNLATAYRQNGQYALALSTLSEIYRALDTKHSYHDDLIATVMNNIAVTHTLMGEYAVAIDYFEKVLISRQAMYGVESPSLQEVVDNLAVTYWAVHKYDQAIPLFKKSLSLARKEVKYIFPNLTEIEQIQFYRQQKQNFERFNTLAVQSYSQPELLTLMFNNQLLLKSLVFFTNKKRTELIEKQNDPRVKQLVNVVKTKGIQLGHYYQMPVNKLVAMGVSLPAIENEIDSLEKVIRHTVRLEKSEESMVEWRDVQLALKDNEASVDIVRFRKYDILPAKDNSLKQIKVGFTDSIYYAALITKKETQEYPELVLLKDGSALEKRYVNYYRNTLKFDIDDTISYDQFWRPIESRLAQKDYIFISNDGIFHQVNLNVIHDTNGKFIIEKFNLHLLMNAGQLAYRRDNSSIDFKKMVLFGNPSFGKQPLTVVGDPDGPGTPEYEALPGSLAEIEGIIKTLNLSVANTQIFTSQAANEMNFKKVVSPSILHIATHGFFSDTRVVVNDQVKNDFLFHSGIVLSPRYEYSKNEDWVFENDGIITAYDVMNMDLTNTDLVVLSACETGLGKIETGEGVYGLQRSFLQAGAQNILVSLWKVEDNMTKDLMIKFYSYLGNNHSSREAFKLAQLDMLHAIRNPRQWGGFVMAGGVNKL